MHVHYDVIIARRGLSQFLHFPHVSVFAHWTVGRPGNEALMGSGRCSNGILL